MFCCVKRALRNLVSVVMALILVVGMLPSLAYADLTMHTMVPQSVGKRVVQVSTGYDCSAALVDDGSQWTWGSNRYGVVGDGTTEERLVPTKMLDDEVVADGDLGSCKWLVMQSGSLIIRPTDGISGELDIIDNVGPWYGYRNSITNAIIEPGVKASSLRNLFHGMFGLESIDMANLETRGITDMSFAFDGCRALREVDLSAVDTAQVESMCYMFRDCYSLKKVTFPDTRTPLLANVSSMFEDCSSIEQIDFSRFDFSSMRNMASMFKGCKKLCGVSFPVEKSVTTELETTYAMFSSCELLKTVDMGWVDASHLRGVGYMFAGCRNLDGIDLSGWNAPIVQDVDGMFAGCTALTAIDVSGVSTFQTSLHNSYVFKDCPSLARITMGADFNVRNRSSYSYDEVLWRPIGSSSEEAYTFQQIPLNKADTYVKVAQLNDGTGCAFLPSRNGWGFRNLSNAELSGNDDYISRKVFDRVFPDRNNLISEAVYLSKGKPGGMCHGMSLSALMTYLGEPAVSEFEWVGDGEPVAASPDSLSELKLNDDRFGYSVKSYDLKLYEYVQALHLAQWMPHVLIDMYANTGIEKVIDYVRDSTSRGIPVLISLRKLDESHSVVAYKVDDNPEEAGDYQIYVYDPNGFDENEPGKNKDNSKIICMYDDDGSLRWEYTSSYSSKDCSISYNTIDSMQRACQEVAARSELDTTGSLFSPYRLIVSPFAVLPCSALDLGYTAIYKFITSEEGDDEGADGGNMYWVEGGDDGVSLSLEYEAGGSPLKYLTDDTAFEFACDGSARLEIGERDDVYEVSVEPESASRIDASFQGVCGLDKVSLSGFASGLVSVGQEGGGLQVSGFETATIVASEDMGSVKEEFDFDPDKRYEVTVKDGAGQARLSVVEVGQPHEHAWSEVGGEAAPATPPKSAPDSNGIDKANGNGNGNVIVDDNEGGSARLTEEEGAATGNAPGPRLAASGAKSANTMKVKARTVTLKASKLALKDKVVKKSKAFKVSKAKGKVSFKATKYDKKAKKKIKVSKSGKVTVKKGLAKGSYKVKVKVTAKGNANYKKASKTVTLKVRVR